MYQGFVRGKGFGQFGLQRLGKVLFPNAFSLPQKSFSVSLSEITGTLQSSDNPGSKLLNRS